MLMFKSYNIASSLCSQLNLNPKFVALFEKPISITNIETYTNIKELNKSLFDLCKLNDIEIKRTVLLNHLSKAYGYKNHHSLKNAYEQRDKRDMLSLLKSVDLNNDTILMKFFKLNRYISEKFSLDEQIFSTTPSANEIDFYWLHNSKLNDIINPEEKRQLNILLEEHGLTPYKNSLKLFSINHNELLQVSYRIIKHYRSFFYPKFFIKEADELERVLDKFTMLSYNLIDKNIEDNLIIVDNYASDDYIQTIKNLLEFIFNYGNINDIEILEEILCTPYANSSYETIDLFKRGSVLKYYNQKLHEEFESNFSIYIWEMIDSINDYSLNISYMQQGMIFDLEERSGKSMKQIILETCMHFNSFGVTYESEEDIIKKVLDDYYGSSKILSIIYSQIQTKEQLHEYYDVYLPLREIANTVIRFLNLYNYYYLKYETGSKNKPKTNNKSIREDIYVNGVRIRVGDEYIIQPTNPKKMKHRDRKCTLIGLDDDIMPHKVSIRFKDNNRLGKTFVDELKPII